MSSTLARLRGETERLRAGRRIFVSSEPVAAYKVANNKKQLLEGDHPFVLALSDDDRTSGTNFDMLEASVGPELHWTLTSINHVLRTVSKYGEPTYLFANIMDTDPQAFVAVTLHRRTPGDELDHLEGVISKVCNFHVAEKKPVQVPGPDQVIGALGKGLAKLVFGGGSSHSKGKEGERNSSSPSPPSRDSYQQQQQQQQQQQYSWLTPAERERAEQARTERERADYLASLDQRRGTHVAAATGSYDAYGRQDEGEDVPTAPKMPSSGRTAMGVGSKADADARLAALKAEMRGEGGAPDLSSSREPRSQRPSAYPAIPTDNTRTPPADWQGHTPGTLSNPFTTGGGSRSNPDINAPPGGFYERDTAVEYNQAGDPVIRSRQQQQQYGQRSSSTDDGGWGAGRDKRAAAYGSDSDRGGYGTGYMGYDDSSSRDRTAGLSEREQRRLKYEQEAREAREEWDRAQREAAARRAAADSAPTGTTKPRVRYHEVKYDTAPYGENQGGWGDERRQPAYAYAGGGQEQKEQERKEKKKGMPGWLEMLGNVYAGGPDL